MVNRATLVGNVGSDPEVRHLDNGGVVANFSLATNETWKDKSGNKQSKVEWHRIVIWGKVAETAEQYVKKGSMLYLEGKITYRSYESDNITKYITEIVLEQYNGVMKMLGGKSEGSSSSNSAPPPPAEENSGNKPMEMDDLPF